MSRGRCFSTAPKPVLRSVVASYPGTRMEELECGHLEPWLFEVNEAPVGTYKRACTACGEGTEEDPFFPKKGGMSYMLAREAKAYCNGTDLAGPCPVRLQCEEFARVNNIRHGVWGGTSQRDRSIPPEDKAQIVWLDVELPSRALRYGT